MDSAWAGDAVLMAVTTGIIAKGDYALNTLLPSSAPSSELLGRAQLYPRFHTYGSGHDGGANFVFCDGSVHFLSNAVGDTPGLLSALSTIAGSEVINTSEF